MNCKYNCWGFIVKHFPVQIIFTVNVAKLIELLFTHFILNVVDIEFKISKCGFLIYIFCILRLHFVLYKSLDPCLALGHRRKDIS